MKYLWLIEMYPFERDLTEVEKNPRVSENNWENPKIQKQKQKQKKKQNKTRQKKTKIKMIS